MPNLDVIDITKIMAAAAAAKEIVQYFLEVLSNIIYLIYTPKKRTVNKSIGRAYIKFRI